MREKRKSPALISKANVVQSNQYDSHRDYLFRLALPGNSNDYIYAIKSGEENFSMQGACEYLRWWTDDILFSPPPNKADRTCEVYPLERSTMFDGIYDPLPKINPVWAKRAQSVLAKPIKPWDLDSHNQPLSEQEKVLTYDFSSLQELRLMEILLNE